MNITASKEQKKDLEIMLKLLLEHKKITHDEYRRAINMVYSYKEK